MERKSLEMEKKKKQNQADWDLLSLSWFQLASSNLHVKWVSHWNTLYITQTLSIVNLFNFEVNFACLGLVHQFITASV